MAGSSLLRFLWPFGRRDEPEAEDSYLPLTAPVMRQRDLHGGGRGRIDFPMFRASALDRPLDGRRDERREITRARFALGTFFTPTQPVADRASFAGRLAVLARLISAIESQRSHVVLHGERGIGKTSMLHVLTDIARESSYIVSYATCGANANFPDLFRAVMHDVPLRFHREVAPNTDEAESGRSFADRLPKGPFDSSELADLCTDITGTRVLIVLDEYDRSTDARFRQQVAELIKNLSDRSARVQLVIAGVASNLQELIGYVPSIRRNVIGFPMPRLEEAEVREMIALGEEGTGIHFDPDLTRIIHLLALGSPYLARLLCHHASVEALDQGRLSVNLGHLRRALDQVILEIEGRMAPRAVAEMRKFVGGRYDPLVAALGEASRSIDGWFGARAVVDLLPSASITPLQVEQELAGLAGQLELESDVQDGERRFRFIDDALPIYLWLMVGRLRLDSGTLEEALAHV